MMMNSEIGFSMALCLVAGRPVLALIYFLLRGIKVSVTKN